MRSPSVSVWNAPGSGERGGAGVNRSAPPAFLRFTAETYARLRLYVELCPSEIGGLGEVLAEGDGLLVTGLSLLDQRVSSAETELEVFYCPAADVPKSK